MLPSSRVFPMGDEPLIAKEEEKKKKKRKKRHKEESSVEADSLLVVEEVSRKKIKPVQWETEEDGAGVTTGAGSMESGYIWELRPDSCWKNLDLVLALRRRDIPLQRKIEFAFQFVKFRGNEESSTLGLPSESKRECIGVPRLISSLSDWVQLVMVPSDVSKPGRRAPAAELSSGDGLLEPCLDSRFWFVLFHCLRSEYLESLSFSSNVMKSAARVLKEASVFLESRHHENECIFLRDVLNLTFECLSIIFNLRGRAIKFNLEVWVSTSSSALEVIHKSFLATTVSDEYCDVFLKVSSLVLEMFAKYLAVHPNPKNLFTIFVEKILSPSLLFLPVLMNFVKATDFHMDSLRGRWAAGILKTIEDILSNGLFHSAHIDGFLNLHPQVPQKEDKKDELPLGKKKAIKESNLVIKSYHKHMFHKLEQLRIDEKNSSLVGVGLLLDLFFVKVAKQQGTLKRSLSAKASMKSPSLASGSGGNHLNPSSTDGSKEVGYITTVKERETMTQTASACRLDESMHKSLFGMFAELMKPLLLSVRKYSESLTYQESETLVSVLSNTHYVLESINNLLAILLKDKFYLRAEDTSEELRFSFLKEIYNTVFAFAARLSQLCSSTFQSFSSCIAQDAAFSYSSRSMGTVNCTDIIDLVAKDVVVAFGYLLDIDYRALENDMVEFWLLLLSFLALTLSQEGDCHDMLALHVLRLGCHFIHVYSELRQILKPILALCKSARSCHILNYDGCMNQSFSTSDPYLTSESFVKAVIALFCSQELKVAISDAVKTAPEGQASSLIVEMIIDVKETFSWIKNSSSGVDREGDVHKSEHIYDKELHMHARLFGRGLSELYVLILDSILVTTGNCVLVGNSVKKLVKAVRPFLRILLDVHSDSLNKFCFSVTGRCLSGSETTAATQLMAGERSCASCLILFFIRLYASCRSLYRQSLCLFPPDMARKGSEAMGDLFAAFSGKELTEQMEWMNFGYFSWIRKPGVPFFDFMQSMSSFFQGEDSCEDCAPLVYVFHTVCLQRLNDLNRQLSAFAFLEERYAHLNDAKCLEVGASSVSSSLLHADQLPLRPCSLHSRQKLGKERKIWTKLLALSKTEACALTAFTMKSLFQCLKGYAPLRNSLASEVGRPGGGLVAYEQESWDFGVGSINYNSLPVAVWWLLCQNVDVWFASATNRHCKKFLSRLLQLSLPFIVQDSNSSSMDVMVTPACLSKVMLHHISMELLNDTFLYEQPTLCRYLTSRVCHSLKNSLPPAFASTVNFDCLPEWSELVAMIEKNQAVSLCFEDPKDKNSLHFGTKESMLCHRLLNFSCWTPKVCLGSKGIKTYVAHIINIERLVALSLLRQQSDVYEALKLFLCCRRALKYLTVRLENEGLHSEFSFFLRIFGSSSSLQWLLTSVSELPQLAYLSLENNQTVEVTNFIFSLVQQTSHIFFAITEGQSKTAAEFLTCEDLPRSLSYEKSSLADFNERSMSEAGCSCIAMHLDEWNWLKLLGDTLLERTRILHSILDEANTQNAVRPQDLCTSHWIKISSLLSCFHGFIEGLLSGLGITGNSSKRRFHYVSDLKQVIDTFEGFVNCCLIILLAQNSSSPQKFVTEPLNGSVLENGSYCSSLNQSLLEELLKGQNVVLAFLVGQLFKACASILKIKQLLFVSTVLGREREGSEVVSTSMDLVIGVSNLLLLRLYDLDVQLHPFAFIWLSGLLKYLQIVGSYFSSIGIVSSQDIYGKMIDLHVKLLAKCISLHEGAAFLGTLETSLCLEGDQFQFVPSKKDDSFPVRQDHILIVFKSELRMSLSMFVKKPLQSHLLSAIQVLERALVGIHEGCPTNYNIETGSPSGGSVASTVAAGLECLATVLESVSSRKCSNILIRYFPNFISAVLNIVAHLRSPFIFLKGKLHSESSRDYADPGSVILMCTELLTKFSRQNSRFPMDACFVAQAIHLPGTLFNDFCQLMTFGSARGSLSLSSVAGVIPVSCNSSSKGSITTAPLFVHLYVACCRLLCVVVRHSKREVGRNVGLLGDSMKILLSCLETPNSVLSSSNLLWNVQDAIKCASSLRRVYEEIEKQQDILGRYAIHFLSNYIWIYSGYGQQKTGFKREIDEALRPGVYALMNIICSNPRSKKSDLQQLHVGLEDGPCRSTLAALKHDYEVNFEYGGKV